MYCILLTTLRVGLIIFFYILKMAHIYRNVTFYSPHHLRANFLNYKRPDPRYKWVEISLTCNKHVGFKSLCNKHVGFKTLCNKQVGFKTLCNKQVGFKTLWNKQVGFNALVLSKSFSSFLIGCVRRPTHRQREFEYNW